MMLRQTVFPRFRRPRLAKRNTTQKSASITISTFLHEKSKTSHRCC